VGAGHGSVARHVARFQPPSWSLRFGGYGNLMSNVRFYARRLARRMWFRTGAFCVLAVLAALVSIVLAPYVPESLSGLVGGPMVDQLLGILAASMLPVATFSLATMVAGFQAATTNVTPRATALLIEDKRAQSALATFIGAFLYAVVGLTALNARLYGDAGRVILFGFTILVVVLVVTTLVRWVEDLSRMGRVGETIDRIESATREALDARSAPLHYGGRAYKAVPAEATPVCSPVIGYVQHVDIAGLCEVADSAECDLYVAATPGQFVHLGDPLCWLSDAEQLPDQPARDRLAGCFIVGGARTFEQDPRFGFIVLAEVASRALSPAVNDPGTAIDVIGTGTRLLNHWALRLAAHRDDPPTRKRLYVNPLQLENFFTDLFRPISRDGAGLIEVGITLRKALTALQRLGGGYEVVAAVHLRQSLARARQALIAPDDLAALERVGPPPPA